MRILVILFILYLLHLDGLRAQCSDAGVCTIGDFDQHETTAWGIGLDFAYGFAIGSREDDVNFHFLRMQSGIPVMKNVGLNLRWDALRLQSGPEGDVHGTGDLHVFLQYTVWSAGNIKLNAHTGIKLPTGDANADPQLPQVYQNGLGTTDLIFGFSFRTAVWNALIGYQLAERAFNSNAHMPLRRGDDLYGEIRYALKFLGWKITPELMVIKRLQESRLRRADGTVYDVKDSDPLQINLGTGLLYPLSGLIDLTGHVAFPLLKRDVNVDGLTRSFSLTVGVKVNLYSK